MAANRFYLAPMDPETVETLHDQGFDQLMSSIDSYKNKYFLVINRAERNFFIADTPNLKHSRELIEVGYREQILQTNLKDIQLWH